MVQLRFEDPPEYTPPAGRQEYDTAKNRHRNDLVAELANHPNRWAVISGHASRNRAGQVARALRQRHPAEGSRYYEFRASHGRAGGGGVVYGRFVDLDVTIG